MRRSPCSIIQSTRLGFFYQDSYAIVCYLTCLANRKIKQFYIDKPISHNRSLDILLLNNNGEEEIYEVKSGDRFPERTDDIIEALINLHNYWKDRPSTNLHLVIRKTYKNKIMDFWYHIKRLRDCRRLIAETDKGSAAFIMKSLQLDSADDAYQFCKRLTLIEDYDDNQEYPVDTQPPLIDKAMGIIKDLSSTPFRATDCEFEQPDSFLIFSLLNEISMNAGSGEDLHGRFSKIIINFFARRRLFSQHYTSQNSRDVKESELRNEIAEIFQREFGIEQVANKIGATLSEDGIRVVK